MTVNNLIAIAVTEAEIAARKHDTIEERLRAAMRVTRDHWLISNEGERFDAAVAAIYLLSDENDKRRIEEEKQGLTTINALISGVPVDMERFKGPSDPIGLLKIWREIKDEGKP